jgi:hypothetical protein
MRAFIVQKSDNQSQQDMMKQYRTLQKAATKRRQPIDLDKLDNTPLFDEEAPQAQMKDKLIIQRKNEQIY